MLSLVTGAGVKLLDAREANLRRLRSQGKMTGA